VSGKQAAGTRSLPATWATAPSISAVQDGKCYDTSMGFTPLEALLWAPRMRGIDPSVVTYLMNKEDLLPTRCRISSTKNPDFWAFTGVSKRFARRHRGAQAGNKRAQLTVDMVRYPIRKFVGSYAAAMGGVDAIIFTGGIGENVYDLRREVCEGLAFMGVEFDAEGNKAKQRQRGKISKPGSKVDGMIIPTNEELLIARDTMEIVGKK
jgi:acetate kinase